MAFSINMHMKKNLFLFVFVTLVLCGCHDAYWGLGDSYIYDSGRICMLMDRGYIMDSGYMKIVVPDQVLNFGFDEHYIIAYQSQTVPISVSITSIPIKIVLILLHALKRQPIV